MNELYFKDPNTEQYLPERRINTTMEMQQALLKLIAKVEARDNNIETKLEAMETNIETKLEAVKDKVSNIDEKLSNKVQELEKKINDHCDDTDQIDEVLSKHDKAIDKVQGYIDRIYILENKYKKLEERVNIIELASTKNKAKFIDSFLTILRNIFFVAIATGLIGFLGYLLLTYIKVS